MFGTIQVPMPELDLNERVVFQYAVTWAATAMRQYREHKQTCIGLIAQGNIEGATAYNRYAMDCKRDAYTALRTIRNAFEDRTSREVFEVEQIIEAGCAWFMTPPCSTDECDKCERPCWHHIQVVGEGELCPVGRRFWQFARALTERTDPKDAGWGRDTLRELARAS